MSEVEAARKLDALTDGSLAPDDFSHVDHVVVAFEALRRHGFEDAHARVSSGIRADAC